MGDNHNTKYLADTASKSRQEQHYEAYNPPIAEPGPVHASASNPHTSAPPDQIPSYEYSQAPPLENKWSPSPDDSNIKGESRISKKWRHRLYWMVPLGIFVIVLCVLFEVYKSDFERWVKPLADWLRERESWSWTLPVVILVILSFPPLFGHEIVQLVVGLTYPLGVALGIACVGAILGEAACFIVFKYGFSGWVEKKIRQKIKWAATARVTQQAGFRGVLVIRYSIVPPHLANPLFACTGMKFWLYMSTVVLSLPKSLVFVALGAPSSEGSKGTKYAKVVAIGVVVAITIFASFWIRKKMTVAIKEIEAERAAQGDEELGMLGPNTMTTGPGGDTSYKGVATQDPYSYQGALGSPGYRQT